MSEQRWTIRKEPSKGTDSTATCHGVVLEGPDTEAIEVIPAEDLASLREQVRELVKAGSALSLRLDRALKNERYTASEVRLSVAREINEWWSVRAALSQEPLE